jgi:hypothetical protein
LKFSFLQSEAKYKFLHKEMIININDHKFNET